MKRRGFTLLELIVVIIIIGILATLGFAQYTRMMERARGAEAKQVLGSLRTQAAALWTQLNSGGALPTVPLTTFTDANLGLGTLAGQIPTACNAADSSKYYFSYGIAGTTTGFTATATRCTVATSKAPVGGSALTSTLTTNFNTGTDVWGGTGGY